MKSQLPSHEQLATLAKDNPEKLEALREQWINEIIESAPEEVQRRLKGLQFQIDCQRKLHKSPMGACIAISRMMNESLNQLNILMNKGRSERTEEKHEATIHRFPSMV